jgi:hypothetical protein
MAVKFLRRSCAPAREPEWPVYAACGHLSIRSGDGEGKAWRIWPMSSWRLRGVRARGRGLRAAPRTRRLFLPRIWRGGGRPGSGRAGEDKECRAMLDVFMLVIGIGFFALAVAYAFACERL